MVELEKPLRFRLEEHLKALRHVAETNQETGNEPRLPVVIVDLLEFAISELR